MQLKYGLILDVAAFNIVNNYKKLYDVLMPVMGFYVFGSLLYKCGLTYGVTHCYNVFELVYIYM